MKRDNTKNEQISYDPFKVSYKEIAKGACPLYEACPYLSSGDRLKSFLRIHDSFEERVKEIVRQQRQVIEEKARQLRPLMETRREREELGMTELSLLMDLSIVVLKALSLRDYVRKFAKHVARRLLVYKAALKFFLYVVYSTVLLELFLSPLIESPFLGGFLFFAISLCFVPLTEFAEDILCAYLEKKYGNRIKEAFFKPFPEIEQKLREQYP